MSSFREFLDLYNNYYIPAYSDLVGYIADKPSNMLLDIENTFSHVMVYLDNNGINQDIADQNLDKAYHHLLRLTLDCHKTLWVQMNPRIEDLLKDEIKRKFTVNVKETELIKKYNEYKAAAQDARTTELKNIGKNPLAAIEKYKKATRLGISILECIDPDKSQAYQKFKLRHWLTENGLNLLIGGVIGGLLTTIILKFVFNWAC